jgi:hypothetical protein
MSAAALRFLPTDRTYAWLLDELGWPDVPARRIEVECRHRRTGASLIGVAVEMADADAIRQVLQQHHERQGCSCTRKLWRRYFGCPWPEVPLVRAAA